MESELDEYFLQEWVQNHSDNKKPENSGSGCHREVSRCCKDTEESRLNKAT